MPFCTACGTQNSPEHTFCSNCGARLPDPVAEPISRPVSEPRPNQPYGAPRLPTIDWRRLVVGNWIGAGATAAAILVTAGLLALVVGLLAKPADFGLHNTLTLIATCVGAIFGADFTLSADLDGSSFQTDIGIFPFTLSLITAAVGVLVFRRVTAGYADPVDALLDGARTGLLVALPVTLIAVVFRSDTAELGRGWAAELAGVLGARLDFGSSVVGCLFLGFVTTFCVLGLTVFLRRDWWGPRMTRAHDWLAAPLSGGATLVALLPLAGLIGLGLLLVAGDNNTRDVTHNADDTMAAVAVVFSLLGNAGVWLLALGSGAAFGGGSRTEGTLTGLDGSTAQRDMQHLSSFAEHEPGLWAAPLVTLAVLFAAAFVVARRSGEPTRILGNLLSWLATLVVLIPLLLRLTTLHARYHVDGADAESWSGFLGPDGVQATFFLLLAATLVAVVVALMSRAIDVQRIKGQVTSFAREFQTDHRRDDGPPGFDLRDE